MPKKQVILKITPVGDGAVGKTSMLTSYTNKTVDAKHTPTVFDNYSAMVEVNNGEYEVTLNLADTAGQEDFEHIRKLCYPGTNIFIATFAVDDRKSFENLGSKWMQELHDKKKTGDALGSPIIIVGNKIDLRKKQQCVSKEEGENMCKQLIAKYGKTSKNIQYMECSAITSVGLKEIFDNAIKIHITALAKKNKSTCKS